MSTTITVSTSFIWGHHVGKRLQKGMHCAFAGAGMTASLIHDGIVLQCYGLEALIVWIVAVNVIILFNVHRFNWIK